MIKVRQLSILVLVLIFSACVQHTNSNGNSVANSSNLERVDIEYAEGFDILYEEGTIKIVTQSFGNNAFFRDSIYMRLDSAVNLDPLFKTIEHETIRLACQSSTHLAYLEELGGLNEVVGLCGLKYVNSDEISNVLKKNQVVELCMTDQVQLENLYQCNPDLFLIYPFGSAENNNFSGKGIQTLLISEYLEKSQLARLEWIKLFGVLTGRSKEANTYFKEVENKYLKLKSESLKTEKTFIMNLPFQDKWFMPSSKSVGVELIEDAGLHYFYKNELGTENITHSNELVWNDGVLADYWVIIASRPKGYGLQDLISEESVYKEFLSVKEHQVIFCNTNEVDYFSKGVIEPHVILKDLCFAMGQIKSHNPQYFFLLD